MRKFPIDLLKSRKMTFDQASIFVLVLILVALLGFGPSYFWKILGESPGFSFYFHFHAICMVLWILTVFAQPLLIRNGMISLHRRVGKISYGLFPVMIASILLLTQNQLCEVEEVSGADFFIPMKDVVVMVVAYLLGVYWKNKVALHSRFMIVVMIPMIEPSLVRMLLNILPSSLVDYSYPLTILVVDATILLLAINDFRKRRPKWVFLSLLVTMTFFQAMILLEWTEVDWMISLAGWYAGIGCY